MTKRLTTIAVAKAKPFERRREIPDPGCPSLYLIIQPSGAKSWAVRYRFNGKPKKLTVGSWPKVSLEQARNDATAALLQLKKDVDPAEAKKKAATAARTAADVLARDTVASLAAQYIEKYVRVKTRPLSQKQTESIFRRIVLPAWQGRTVHQIRRRDVIELIEDVAFGNSKTEPRPILANRALAAVRKFFNWLASRDVIAASPCVGVEAPGVEKKRERSLGDAEIVQLWNASGEIGYPYGLAIKLLLLTGQRRSEVGGMRWSEIDKKTWLWLLPAVRTKNRRVHTVPLSEQVREIIEASPVIAGSDYVFGGRAGIKHFARAKAKLDEVLHFAAPWVLHDLRRSAASGMQRIGVDVPVIEQVLNHRSGTFRGIVGVYQQHSYDRQKANALQRWADHVDMIVTDKLRLRQLRARQ